MQRVIFIEVLDDSGRLLQRVRAESFPVSIGRAYSNDVIVDDPYVCPTHLLIHLHESGELEAEDLQSVNGVFFSTPAERIARAIVAPGAQVKIGATALRFRTKADPVPPAVPHCPEPSRQHPDVMHARKRWPDVAALSVGLAWLAWTTYFDNLHIGVRERHSVAAGVIAGIMMLAGFLWVVLNARARRTEFLPLVAAVTMWSVAESLSTTSLDYVSFGLAADEAVGWVKEFVSGILFVGSIYLGSAYVGMTLAQDAKRKLLRNCLAILAGLHLTSYAMDHAFDGLLSSGMEFPGELKPPAFRLVAGKTIDEFLSGATELRPEIDALRFESDIDLDDE